MHGHMRDRNECRHRHGPDFHAAKGGNFKRHMMGGGPGRGFGRGFDDDGQGPRGGRFLGQGDIRVLVLGLIEKEARHGYEIIKQIEDLSLEAYSPSPGVIYPTLTYLEEAGYVTAEMDGTKKRYAITQEGRAYLDENRAMADAIMERLTLIRERVRRFRDEQGAREGSEGPSLPRSVDAAMMNLREVISRRLAKDASETTMIVKRLLEIAEELD
jgi:DNA-binding PadR family transcriptional regulator